jgi:hypothetical protein
MNATSMMFENVSNQRDVDEIDDTTFMMCRIIGLEYDYQSRQYEKQMGVILTKGVFVTLVVLAGLVVLKIYAWE